MPDLRLMMSVRTEKCTRISYIKKSHYSGYEIFIKRRPLTRRTSHCSLPPWGCQEPVGRELEGVAGAEGRPLYDSRL